MSVVAVLRAALQAGRDAIAKTGSISSDVAQKIARRLGVRTAAVATPQALLSTVRDNKFATAWVLYEMYGIGSPELRQLRAADPEVDSIFESFGGEVDQFEDTSSATDITRFSDEFELISEASRAVGGFDNLVKLHKTFTQINESHLVMFQQMKAMSPSFRNV